MLAVFLWVNDSARLRGKFLHLSRFEGDLGFLIPHLRPLLLSAHLSFTVKIIRMASGYLPPPQDADEPQPHPYVHEPLLYISSLPPYITDENLAVAFQACAPFRPNIARDGSPRPLQGTIEFKFLEKGACFPRFSSII